MNAMRKCSFILLFVLICFPGANASERIVPVHNSLDEINACTGKLKLKRVRIWGGDREEDENKFFKMPESIAIPGNKLVYICDLAGHCIKVFTRTGQYVRTIGRRGRGPGDLLLPSSIVFFPQGDLMVFENGGRRFQRFSRQGKSKKIIRSKYVFRLAGVTADNELVVYSHHKTLFTGKLVTLLREDGKAIKEIGMYHDKSKVFLESEQLIYALDGAANIYAAHTLAPVIRKYSKEDRLLQVITIATPYDVPYKVSMDARCNDIEKVHTGSGESKRSVKRTSGGGVMIQEGGKNVKRRIRLAPDIKVDKQNNIYIVLRRRLPTGEEYMNAGIEMASGGDYKRHVKDHTLLEKSDHYMLLVLKPGGKVFAASHLTTLCDGIYIHGNRLFIIDGSFNLRILEYEMHFEE